MLPLSTHTRTNRLPLWGKNILIGYATRYGATREIASHISNVLRSYGANTTLSAAEDIISIRDYDAVIIGSAIYHNNWLPEANELIESQQEDLSNKPFWIFSDGPIQDMPPGQHWYPPNLKPLMTSIHPQDTALFAGKNNPDTLNINDWLTNPDLRDNPNDYRDWQDITRWTHNIAQYLQSQPTTTTHPTK